MFGEKAFNKALKESEDNAILEGIDPATVRPVFEEWWDEQAKAGGRKREFQVRSEFQDVTVDPEPSSGTNNIDLKGLSPKALDRLIEANQ